MCSCEPGWLCSRCAGTVADPAYLLNDPESDPYNDLPDEASPAEYEVPA